MKNSNPHLKTTHSILLLIVVFFNLFDSIAQGKTTISFSFKLKLDSIKTRIYNPPRSEEFKTVILKMKYGESEILNKSELSMLNDPGIIFHSVDLVYTNNTPDQELLNKKRLVELYFSIPELFVQTNTKWNLIEQLGYTNSQDAQKLFHGIVINYIKIPTYGKLSLEDMTKKVKKDKITDSSLFRIFNKIIHHQNELICIDMTGSMSPYYFQVFTWLQLKKNKEELYFSLFNDGDEKDNSLKRIGNTGGVYTFSSNKIDTIINKAFLCVSKGNGGDSPENNIEAMLKGYKSFPKTKEIILIADNWAMMRDYSLISELKIPVKVILCGTQFLSGGMAINTQYLDLAYKTGGAIYTIEEDIDNLAKLKEGEEITIYGKKYKVQSGKFILKS